MTSKTLKVLGARIYVQESGAGVPTLFLHGVPDSGDLWNGVIEQLGAGYHAIVPDLPGLGRSKAPVNIDLSLEGKARFVDALVTALGIEEPLNLIVHDWGGHYGLAWATRHPEKVRRIAISNTAFFSDFKWHTNAQLWRTPVIGELSMAMSSRPALFVAAMRRYAGGLSEAQLRTMYKESMNDAKARRMILKLYRASNPEDFKVWEDQLIAVTRQVPTTVLWGDLDKFAQVNFADRFGDAEVHHFAAGHWLPLEKPAEYAAVLREFLA